MQKTATTFEVKPCPHPLVERLFSSRSIPLEWGGTTPLNVYIPRQQGDYLYSLVRHYRPATTVEVGMANGISTLFIAAALEENGKGQHVAIDPFQSTDWKGIGVGLVKQAGLSHRVRLIEKPS